MMSQISNPATVIKSTITPTKSSAKFKVNPRHTLSTLQPALDSLMDQLELLDNSLTSLQLCAARFSQDEAMYRTEVTSIKYQVVRVMFIDYGNNAEESMSAKDFTDIEVKCLASSTNNLQPFI